jgi:hypothetical protein
LFCCLQKLPLAPAGPLAARLHSSNHTRNVRQANKQQQHTAEDAALLAVLNLPKATMKGKQLEELAALGIMGEPDASRHFYMNKGPQAVSCRGGLTGGSNAGVCFALLCMLWVQVMACTCHECCEG